MENNFIDYSFYFVYLFFAKASLVDFLMIQKVFLGILLGGIVGVFTTSFFIGEDPTLRELVFTKITATSLITGMLCGIYGHFSKSKLQVFIVSIIIGILVFYLKYKITGHHFDPVTMGAFTGCLVGGGLAVIRKATQSYKLYRRIKRIQQTDYVPRN